MTPSRLAESIARLSYESNRAWLELHSRTLGLPWEILDHGAQKVWIDAALDILSDRPTNVSKLVETVARTLLHHAKLGHD